MQIPLVMTVIGPDRTGLVESVARLVAEHDGNWLESRMCRLGGEFAGILRVHLPAECRAALEQALAKLPGLAIVVQSDETPRAAAAPQLAALEVVGQDRPGIVREITHALAAQGVNVEELATECVSAPMSGEPLFQARAKLLLPGGQTTVTNDSTLVCSFAYNDANELLIETYSSGSLSGLIVTNGYDSLLRHNAIGVSNYSATLTTYSYDNASRLKTVASGTNTGSYAYLANSPLVSQITFTNGSALRMTTAKQYDLLNQLTSITNQPSGSSAIGYRYAYNTANQRAAITNSDNSRWAFSYDSLGQVTSGKKYWSDATPVAGQQFEYTFDDIGNRKSTASGGDQYGANLHSAGYTNNNLNQLTSRGVPSYVDVQGSATNTATVTVNNQATYRNGDYFRAELTATNTSAAVWFGATNLAVLNNGTNADIIASTTGFVFVAQSPEAFGFDADGNTTNDGRWSLTWDGENRLVKMESLTNAPAESKRRLTFSYDYRGRRITKAVESWTGATWALTLSNKLVYDGWNLIAELNATNNVVIRSYVWGLDLSGTMQGAGGVGGLLAVNDAANGANFCAYDGNGNLTALVKATDGSVSANYEYGPFGELVRATGLMAKANPFRFSTKFQDDESDYLYYGYRSYNPNMGRWLSRDPINEIGFKVLTSTLRKPFYVNEETSLYAILHNSALNSIDSLGLMIVRPAERAFIRTACKCAVAQAAYFVIEYGETVWNAMDYITWPGDCVYAKTQGAILFGWFLGFGADAWLEICLDKNCHPKTRYIIFTTRDA